MSGQAKPNAAQRQFNQFGTAGMRKTGLRQAHQIASQRQFTYEPVPVSCISCGGPRAPHKHPICDACGRRRKEGLR